MDGALSAYSSLATGFVTLFQRAGLLTIPLVIAVTVVVNWLGGEKAIRAVGITILVVAILNVILASATGLGGWIGGLSSGAAAAAPPSGH